MKDNLSDIRKLIQEGELNIAIEQLTAYIQSDKTDNDEPYYLYLFKLHLSYINLR